MKQRMLVALAIMAVICCYSPAFAGNGVDWLIIKKQTGLSAEEIANQAKKSALKEKKKFKFSELYAEEKTPEKGETVSFEQLRIQDNGGVSSSNLVSGQLFRLEDTVGEMVVGHCDVPSNMNLKELIGAVLRDNDLDWESAKHLQSGFEFFIQSKWLKEKYRNPLETIAQLESEKKALTVAAMEKDEEIARLKKELNVEGLSRRNSLSESGLLLWNNLRAIAGDMELKLEEKDGTQVAVSQIRTSIESLTNAIGDIRNELAKASSYRWYAVAAAIILLVILVIILVVDTKKGNELRTEIVRLRDVNRAHNVESASLLNPSDVGGSGLGNEQERSNDVSDDGETQQLRDMNN